MTTALSTSRPKLEIDGRPISRLLSGLTPSAHPVSLFLAPPPSRWKASSSFIAGKTRLFWAAGHAGPDRGQTGRWLAPRSGWSKQRCPHAGTSTSQASVQQQRGGFETEACSLKEDKRQITGGRRVKVTERRDAYRMES